MKYTYKLAAPEDEKDLREFIASMPMPGSISVRFERNPDFFEAAAVEGNTSETLVVKEDCGRITGIGSRAEKEVYINGEKKRAGYLSGLRVEPGHRSLRYLANAYKELHKLHLNGDSLFYLSTIVEENHRARKVLESGRGFLPDYKFAGEYLTFALGKKIKPAADIEIRRASPKDLPKLIEFLNAEGRKRQFFPVYTAADFKSGLLKNLDIKSVFLAFDKDEISGCIGVWDQHSYKQVIIDSYSSIMKLGRPFYNIQAGLMGRPGLPKAGEETLSYKAAIPLAADGNKNILLSLLSHAVDAALENNRHLLLGLHEREPFASSVQALKCRIYKSRLYTVNWSDGADEVSKIDPEMIPYLELGGL